MLPKIARASPMPAARKKGGRKHLACLFVFAFSQQSCNIAVGAHGQHGAAHQDHLIQGCVDAHSRCRVCSQSGHKIGVRHRINRIDQKRDDRRNCHLGDDPGNGRVEHQLPTLLLIYGLHFSLNLHFSPLRDNPLMFVPENAEKHVAAQPCAGSQRRVLVKRDQNQLLLSLRWMGSQARILRSSSSQKSQLWIPGCSW